MDRQALSKRLNSMLAERQALLRQVAQERDYLSKAEQQVKDATEAQQVVQSLAEAIQNEVHKEISLIVTRCLHAVFGDSYEFRIIFERKRGRTEARFCLVTKDGQEIAPLDSCGGGVVDVCCFGLRLAAIRLARPLGRQLLCADEPFRFVSSHYQTAVRDLLLALAQELDVQIIMVSHMKRLRIGKIIDLNGGEG